MLFFHQGLNYSLVDYDFECLPVILQIVEVMDAEAWDANVKVYGEATEGHNYLDMNRVNTSVALTFGCARIVFLNKFIKDVLVSFTGLSVSPLQTGKKIVILLFYFYTLLFLKLKIMSCLFNAVICSIYGVSLMIYY